jgi:plasmid maintenance system antidote protein VapI
MPFEPNQKTRNFIKAVKSLVESGKVSGYITIADTIDWDRTAISNVINGRRNVPPEVYKRFTDVYNKEIEVDNRDDLYFEIALQNQAYTRVILRAMAEVLSHQRGESLAKTLTDLEAAVKQEIQVLTERL